MCIGVSVEGGGSEKLFFFGIFFIKRITRQNLFYGKLIFNIASFKIKYAVCI